MKKYQYILLALVCSLFASCMGEDYAEPSLAESPYGNNELTESGVITIAQLKEKYATVISQSSMTEVTEDIKIKGIVTGNDIGGNIYNEFAVQDATGALLVCVNQGGLFGYLPVGQEILIDLKGLMLGGYGQQLEIGGIYTNLNTGAKSIGRMSRYVWANHYKLIGQADPQKAIDLIEVFDVSKMRDSKYMEANAGKLMTMSGVTLQDANGTAVYAPDDGSVTLTANCANRAFTGYSSSYLVLRTSTYADFANAVMPTEQIDVTGIFTRYRNTWQVLLRSADDVQLTPQFSIDDLPGTGYGTAEAPFNVARALALVESGHHDPGAEVYVKGIICNVQEVSTQYGNATYFISDDGQDNNSLEIYRGYYLDGEKFTEATAGSIVAGKKVTIAGKLVLYGTTIEFTTGSKIISIE
ncbi:MAG: hypothetical protein J6I61_08910 [Prevotella sp.]|nr:hypothetical protein [Prevotella sp.]